MHKVNLCEACSKEKGVQDPTSFALADLLLGIGAAEEIEKGAPPKICRKPWLTRTTRVLPRCAIKLNGSKLIFRIQYEIFKHAFHCGGMAAR